MGKIMTKFVQFVCIFQLCFFLVGCIMPSSNITVSPNAKLSSIKSIVVWRFRDGGNAKNSGDIATTAVESAFLRRRFKLISYSKIQDILSIEIGYSTGMSLDAGMLTPKVLSRIKNETGADAIIIGSVINSWCNTSYIPPCWIEFSFKMIETSSGNTIVSANVSDDGYSLQSAAQQAADKAIKKIH